VSLIDVIEQIEIESTEVLAFPASVPFSANLVTLWARDQPDTPSRAVTRVRFLSSAGTELGRVEGEVELETSTRVRQHMRIQGLRVDGTGWHEWEISWRAPDNELWTTVARIPLEVRINITAEAQPRATA
jgi:hypothetical protein